MSTDKSTAPLKNKRALVFILYTVLFYGFWTLWTICIRPEIKDAMSGSLIFEILANCVKLAVWTVPALLLIRKYDNALFIRFRQMFTERVSLRAALLWILLFSALSGGERLIALIQGRLHINPDFSLKSHLWLLIVGLTEETVFRGWLLNAAVKSGRDTKMIALNAVMFLCIHFPGWIQKGTFVSAFTGFGFISILVFSVLISICFLKHKNIVLPIFIHMLYDFILEFWIVS